MSFPIQTSERTTRSGIRSTFFTPASETIICDPVQPVQVAMQAPAPVSRNIVIPKKRRRKSVRTGDTAIQVAIKATVRQSKADMRAARKLIQKVNSGNRALAKYRKNSPVQWLIIKKC